MTTEQKKKLFGDDDRRGREEHWNSFHQQWVALADDDFIYLVPGLLELERANGSIRLAAE